MSEPIEMSDEQMASDLRAAYHEYMSLKSLMERRGWKISVAKKPDAITLLTGLRIFKEVRL